MPVYEYRCRDCRRKTAVFVRSLGASVSPACEHCGGRRLVRLFSTFAVRRSTSGDLDDDGFGDDFDESDPKAMAAALRRYGGDLRDEMGPEFDEVLDRMEAGEMPDDDDLGGPGDDGEDDLKD